MLPAQKCEMGDAYTWVLPEKCEPGTTGVAGKVLAPSKAGESLGNGQKHSKLVPGPQQGEEQA